MVSALSSSWARFRSLAASALLLARLLVACLQGWAVQRPVGAAACLRGHQRERQVSSTCCGSCAAAGAPVCDAAAAAVVTIVTHHAYASARSLMLSTTESFSSPLRFRSLHESLIWGQQQKPPRQQRQKYKTQGVAYT